MNHKRMSTLRKRWASLSQFLLVNKQEEPSSHEERISRYAPAATTQGPHRYLTIQGLHGLWGRATKVS